MQEAKAKKATTGAQANAVTKSTEEGGEGLGRGDK